MNTLKNFEFLSFIGEGAFGVVKLAQDKETKEKVAIKILEKKKILNKEDQIRVKREIEILKKTNHLNVIKAKKIFNDSENIYIIMEYCEKGELFEHIVDEVCLEGKEAAYYFYQLINGLESLHKNGIVHRDLKPENLLINKNNILKIIDFGLSNYNNKLLSTLCGSPCYASPEMLYGKKYDGILVDIWSTGIVLYAMLCGSVPFDNEDHDKLYKKIMKGKIAYPENLEKDSIDLLKKILVVNPRGRISIKDIKKHPFYQKGRKEFIRMHPALVKNAIRKYGNKKVENNKNMEKKEVNDKKNKENFNSENLRRKRKILIDNLKLKTDGNNLNNLESNPNIFNTENIFDINSKMRKDFDFNRKKNIISQKVSNNSNNNFDLIMQKNDKENFDLRKRIKNHKTLTEYNSLDKQNNNNINNKFIAVSNSKKIFLDNNNFFDNNGKMIKRIKNDLAKRNINNLNNINEERFYNTASKPNKNKIKIEQKKRMPNNIKEKNIIKNIFPHINNYDVLQQSVLLKLKDYKKDKKGKISQKISGIMKYKNKNNNMIGFNKTENENASINNNSFKNSNYSNNYNIVKKFEKIKPKKFEYYSNSVMLKLKKKIKDNNNMINNQYNTIIYSNTINNLSPTFNNTLNNTGDKSQIQNGLNPDLQNLKKKLEFNNNKSKNNYISVDNSIRRNHNHNIMISNKQIPYNKHKYYIHQDPYNNKILKGILGGHYRHNSKDITENNAINNNISKKELELNNYSQENPLINKSHKLIKEEKGNSLEKKKYGRVKYIKIRNVRNNIDHSKINKIIQKKLNRGVYISSLNSQKKPKPINRNINNNDRIDTTVVYKNNLTEIKFPLNRIIINNNTIVNSKNIYNNNKNLYYNKSEMPNYKKLKTLIIK